MSNPTARPFVVSVEQLQQQLEEAQRLAGIGSWSWDLGTGDVAWSRETYRVLGYGPDVQPSFERVLALALDEQRQADFIELMQSALRGERAYDFEIPARLIDGRLITLHTRGAVERAPDGTPLRMVGTVQDVTSMRAAEQSHERRTVRRRGARTPAGAAAAFAASRVAWPAGGRRGPRLQQSARGNSRQRLTGAR